MRAMLRATWVIARRDYVATVWSRTFLFFLLFPLLMPLLSGGVGMLAARDSVVEGPPPTAMVRVRLDAASYEALVEARARLARRLGNELPEFSRDAPADAPVLFGSLDHPHLVAPDRRIRALAADIGLIVDQARTDTALGRAAPEPVRVALLPQTSPKPAGKGRATIGRAGQVVLFVLIMMLAGMMISNLVEEKSNKVIELLLAAVPMDAVFAGKLLGMLAVSLTGILLWSGAAGIAVLSLLPRGLVSPPAVGWPMFVLFGFLYYVMAFSLLGGVYLGIGAQAASVREVQTISLPLTIGQLVVFALASGSVSHPDGTMGLFAAILPWSSPYAMLSRAAVDPRLWPHLLGLAWQLFCVLVTIRVSAGLFRRNILKSGSGGKPRRIPETVARLQP